MEYETQTLYIGKDPMLSLSKPLGRGITSDVVVKMQLPGCTYMSDSYMG